MATVDEAVHVARSLLSCVGCPVLPTIARTTEAFSQTAIQFNTVCGKFGRNSKETKLERCGKRPGCGSALQGLPSRPRQCSSAPQSSCWIEVGQRTTSTRCLLSGTFKVLVERGVLPADKTFWFSPDLRLPHDFSGCCLFLVVELETHRIPFTYAQARAARRRVATHALDSSFLTRFYLGWKAVSALQQLTWPICSICTVAGAV